MSSPTGPGHAASLAGATNRHQAPRALAGSVRARYPTPMHDAERLLFHEVKKRRQVLTDRFGGYLNLRANGAGELAVAASETLLSLKQVDAAPSSALAAYHTQGEGTISYDYDSSSTILTSSASTGTGRALMQSKWAVNYQPGKRALYELTYAPIGDPEGYIDVGAFTDKDGFHLRVGPNGASWVHRAFGDVVEEVAQEYWSIDNLDGKGPSRRRADWSKAQRPFIRYAWLEVGDCECGFILDDVPIVCHRFAFENALDRPYVRTPNLPLRWEASGPATSMRAICGQVGSEGGHSPLGVPGVVQRRSVVAVTTSATREIASLRLRPSSTSTVFLTSMAVITATNQSQGLLLLLRNPTFSAGTGWVDVDSGLAQHLQSNTTGRLITGEGLCHACVPFSTVTRTAELALDPIIPIGKEYDGTSDVLTMAVHNPFGIAPDCVGSLGFRVVP